MLHTSPVGRKRINPKGPEDQLTATLTHPRQACTMAALTAAARAVLPVTSARSVPLLWALPLLLLSDALLLDTSVPPPADLRPPPLRPCFLCTALIRWFRPEASSICPALARLATALLEEFMLWLWNCSILKASS
jgi:hypothetical protein